MGIHVNGLFSLIILFLKSLKGSFWFIPVLMVFGAMTMSFYMIILDRDLHIDTLRFYGVMFAVSPEGARSVLSTIAGSMMTVAGVTFSITIVALNLASSQFGPACCAILWKTGERSLFWGPLFPVLFTVCLSIARQT